jgi:hypothetical protein
LQAGRKSANIQASSGAIREIPANVSFGGAEAMLDNLPHSVRYVKNGSKGKWWGAALARKQIHFGWRFVPDDLLRTVDLARIKDCIQNHDEYKHSGAATADFNALRLVLERPSRHVWVATKEIAFVQVKSEARQSALDDYVGKFQARRELFHRMIFAVHSPTGTLAPPENEPVHVWKVDRIAELAVQLGLGEWIANRL